MIIYGILLNIKNIIIDLVSVLIIFEGKFANLFLSENDFEDKFKDYIYKGSEHITLYQIYTDYYLSGNTENLNLINWKKVDEIKENLLTITNNYSYEYIEKINNKYNFIDQKIMDYLSNETMSSLDKINIAIFLANIINLAYFDEDKKLKNGKTIKLYKNKNTLIPVQGQLSFIIPSVEPIIDYNHQKLIYNNHVNFGSRSIFSVITILPKNLEWII